jgi:hypothetical protein
VTSLPFLLPKSSTVDCEKSKALVNWFYWIQTSSQATKLAARTATVPFGQVPNLRRRALTELAKVRCAHVVAELPLAFAQLKLLSRLSMAGGVRGPTRAVRVGMRGGWPPLFGPRHLHRQQVPVQ